MKPRADESFSFLDGFRIAFHNHWLVLPGMETANNKPQIGIFSSPRRGPFTAPDEATPSVFRPTTKGQIEMTAENEAPCSSSIFDCTRVVRSLQAMKELVAGYLAVSVLTLAAIISLRNHTHEINSAVWTRGIIVVVSALLTLVFVIGTARGSKRSYLRLRIISMVMPVAIVVIIALPGVFPVWMKIEQGVCGLLLIAIAVRANSRHMRSAFKPETDRATGSGPTVTAAAPRPRDSLLHNDTCRS